MGKDKLSTAVIEQITAIASRVGAESAMEKIKAERRRGSKELTRATKKQLESYRTIKKTLLEETHFTQEEEAEIRWRFLEDFMSAMPYTSKEVDSVVGEKERKRQETMYCLHEIETALRIYKEECEASGNEERKRRYRELYDLYFAEDPLTVAEIAKKEHVTEKTVYHDIGIAVGAITIGIHGFRALKESAGG